MPTLTLPPTPVPPPVTATAKDNLRIRAGPSTSDAILDRLTQGSSARVVGRTPTGDWLRIELPTDPNGRGWISAEFVDLSGPVDSIPIVQPGGGPGQPQPPSYPYP